MSKDNTSWSIGQRVQFDVDGQKKKFFGVVTRLSMHRGETYPLIQPDISMGPQAKITNIEKVAKG